MLLPKYSHTLKQKTTRLWRSFFQNAACHRGGPGERGGKRLGSSTQETFKGRTQATAALCAHLVSFLQREELITVYFACKLMNVVRSYRSHVSELSGKWNLWVVLVLVLVPLRSTSAAVADRVDLCENACKLNLYFHFPLSGPHANSIFFILNPRFVLGELRKSLKRCKKRKKKKTPCRKRQHDPA